MEQTGEHRNRIAVVTGGSNGIGQAIAKRLQSEGAKVFVFDANREPWADHAIQAAEPNSIGFVGVDVSKESNVGKAFDLVASREARIHYLICCAAVFLRQSFLRMVVRSFGSVPFPNGIMLPIGA